MDKIEALATAVGEKQAVFLEAVAALRPRLHRYCSRMAGSVLDGEDLVQEVLAQAFFNLSKLGDADRLEPWLFRIAHNRAIDLLRRRQMERGYLNDIAASAPSDVHEDGSPVEVGAAFARLVSCLPPKERACVLLKDALGYPLSDVAEIVGSTVGGVKAALHRGRAKLRTARADDVHRPVPETERGLVQTYIERFNGQDWDGVLALVRADARLHLVDVVEGNAREVMTDRYLSTYAGLPWNWRYGLAVVDGVELVTLFEVKGDVLRPRGALRLLQDDGEIIAVNDYFHIDYLFDRAEVRPR